MRLKKVLKKATSLPLELIVAEGACFHEGNTVSIQKLYEPSKDNGFEGVWETIAEFWPATGGVEKIDAALMLHCRDKFEGLVKALEKATTIIENEYPDNGCEEGQFAQELRRLLDDAEEVEGI